MVGQFPTKAVTLREKTSTRAYRHVDQHENDPGICQEAYGTGQQKSTKGIPDPSAASWALIEMHETRIRARRPGRIESPTGR